MQKLFLPRLGQTMEEALLASWLVQPGAEVVSGEPIYEVETEKVTTGVEATVSGTLVRVLVSEGSQVAVGEVMGVVAEPGETPSEAEIDVFLGGGSTEVVDAPTSAAVADTEVVEVADANDAGSGADRRDRVRAMPRTRALAREHGFDLDVLAQHSGEGFVSEDAVTKAIEARLIAESAPHAATSKPPTAPSVEVDDGPLIRERIPLTHVWRSMAEVTTRTWTTVPQFTQSVEVDASSWRRQREELAAATAQEVSVTDLILRAFVASVQRNPRVNSTFAGDELIVYRDINISLAVDTPDGLMVPVLHRFQDLSDSGRARRLREQVQKAKTGAIELDDVRGGTITLSNLGMLGVQGGVPLLTAPQACIVFVGATVDRVVPIDGAIGIRPMCTLVGSFDHRALDGATAGRFMSSLKSTLEEGVQ